MARFQREAQVTSNLGHPHIVEVFDFNHTPQGFPYLVMELLQGEDLAARLAREQRLSVEESIVILQQLASALHAAHKKQVIHRDLKTGNIFLCRRDEPGLYIKVLDFGMSKVLKSPDRLTMATAILGTPWYMSPEQVAGKTAEADARTDIFALGIILHEILSGQRPFGGSTLQEVFINVATQQPPPLSSLCQDLPPMLDSITQRAMAKRPEDRFQSMADLLEALGELDTQEMPNGAPGSPVSEEKATIVVKSPVIRGVSELALAETVFEVSPTNDFEVSPTNDLDESSAHDLGITLPPPEFEVVDKLVPQQEVSPWQTAVDPSAKPGSISITELIRHVKNRHTLILSTILLLGLAASVIYFVGWVDMRDGARSPAGSSRPWSSCWRRCAKTSSVGWK